MTIGLFESKEENLTLCPHGNFSCFLSSADFFQNQLFQKILSGIPSECQTDWVQIRPRGYKTFFILNSAEHKFILLINVKMPTSMINTTFERLKARNFFVSILVFMSS